MTHHFHIPPALPRSTPLSPALAASLANAPPPLPMKRTTPGVVVRVVNGDTLDANLEVEGGRVVRVRMRITGVDAPERKGKSVFERDAAVAAAHVAARFVNPLAFRRKVGDEEPVFDSRPELQARVRVRVDKHDKYGGRFVGDVKPAHLGAGASLSSFMLQVGAAQAYSGRGPKHPWSRASLCAIREMSTTRS